MAGSPGLAGTTLASWKERPLLALLAALLCNRNTPSDHIHRRYRTARALNANCSTQALSPATQNHCGVTIATITSMIFAILRIKHQPWTLCPMSVPSPRTSLLPCALPRSLRLATAGLAAAAAACEPTPGQRAVLWMCCPMNSSTSALRGVASRADWTALQQQLAGCRWLKIETRPDSPSEILRFLGKRRKWCAWAYGLCDESSVDLSKNGLSLWRERDFYFQIGF